MAESNFHQSNQQLASDFELADAELGVPEAELGAPKTGPQAEEGSNKNASYNSISPAVGGQTPGK